MQAYRDKDNPKMTILIIDIQFEQVTNTMGVFVVHYFQQKMKKKNQYIWYSLDVKSNSRALFLNFQKCKIFKSVPS